MGQAMATPEQSIPLKEMSRSLSVAATGVVLGALTIFRFGFGPVSIGLPSLLGPPMIVTSVGFTIKAYTATQRWLRAATRAPSEVNAELLPPLSGV